LIAVGSPRGEGLLPPFPPPPASVPGSFGRRGAVIDDPDFAEVVNADHELIELGAIVDGVHVGPIGTTAAAACAAERTEAAADSPVGAARLLRGGCATNFTAIRL